MTHGDAIDEGGDDPNPSSCGGDGEDLGEALEFGGWGEGGFGEGYSLLVKWRKEREKWKEKVFIGFWICEGDVNN